MLEIILDRFNFPDADPTALLAKLVAEIRPQDHDDAVSARRSLEALCYLLGRRPELRAGLRRALDTLGQTHRHADLYISTGIPPNTGFFSEIFRRLGHKLLPDVLDADLLRTVVRQVFHQPDDGLWVLGVGEDAWISLLQALRYDEMPANDGLPRPLAEMLRSLRVLSFWIAAFGMEPELLRLEPSLETYESPFVAQNAELLTYIDTYPASWRQLDSECMDDRHLRVLFEQCREVIARVRKRAAREGTSVRLTYHLQRLRQLLRRCEQLLDILAALRCDPDGQTAYPAVASLFTRLVRDECRRDDLREHWRRNVELLALRVTDNASQHGEHYITETRAEYGLMARSAMIGGCVIAFMAIFKLALGKIEMAPVTGGLLFCLNYGLGFCLVHMLHGTVATKQPAMTANVIAASLGESGGKLREVENLSRLIACTVRSQFVAILGNVLVVVPLAAFFAWLIFLVSGEHFVNLETANQLMRAQTPLGSGALFYAAIAGVCLFLAGLVSGYFDNYAAYNRVPERLRQLRSLRRLLGPARLARVSAYIGDNLGALTGNFLFGFMLGGVTLLGVLFGLPLDIRHVTFSSAFVGVALVAHDFVPDPWLFVSAAVGAALIGVINLVVSFSLALNVALRARQITEPQWKPLTDSLLRHLRQSPRDFFLPPRKAEERRE